MEGGRSFMAAWRKEEVVKTRLDIARKRERQRETGEVVIAHESVEFCGEATPIGLVDESKEFLSLQEYFEPKYSSKENQNAPTF